MYAIFFKFDNLHANVHLYQCKDKCIPIILTFSYPKINIFRKIFHAACAIKYVLCDGVIIYHANLVSVFDLCPFNKIYKNNKLVPSTIVKQKIQPFFLGHTLQTASLIPNKCMINRAFDYYGSILRECMQFIVKKFDLSSF